MLPSYLLSLREGIEAALIIGIVLGALRQIRRTDLSPALWWGVIAASGVSLLADSQDASCDCLSSATRLTAIS